jgi:hypothetical protein
MTWPRALTLALVTALLLAAPASAGVRLVSRDEPLPTAERSEASARAVGARTLAPRRAPARFNMVGLHWRGAGEVWFRTAAERGRWSAWRSARPEPEDGPDAGSPEAESSRGWKLGNPYWTGASRRIQYRLAGQVTRLRAHFLWSAVGAAPVARRAAAIPNAPVIISRAQWGADESIVSGSPSYADRLAFSVVHHTAGTYPSTPAQSAAVVRGVLTYHVRSNGWNDIGYNFLVDSFGQVFEGRAGGTTRNVIGAHAQGFNTGSVGVSLLGNYESAVLTPEARDAVASLLAWRLDLAHVDPGSSLTRISAGSPKWPSGTPVTLQAVSGHRDVGSTACPGANVYAKLGTIAADAAARGGPKLFDPRVEGSAGGPVRFTARLSAPLPWTVTVTDASNRTVASGGGSGTAVDWTWNAAAVAPGRYSYSIDAGPTVRPARGLVGGLLPLELETLTVSPGVVTPNGDGVDDTADVGVRLTVPATIAMWLDDSAGRRVATLVTSRALDAGTTPVTFRGRSATGQVVPDGRYRLHVEAENGTESDAAEATIVLDRTLGHLSVRPELFSPNGDGRRESVALGYRLERQATVRVRILSGSRVLTTLTSARQGGSSLQSFSLTWNGRVGGARVRDGRYQAVVEATTSLGTRRLTEDVTLDASGPRVGGLRARRDRGGTLVTFRLSEPGRVTVRFGPRAVRFQSAGGSIRVWRRFRPAIVAVSAIDRAENQGRAASARVRR